MNSNIPRNIANWVFFENETTVIISINQFDMILEIKHSLSQIATVTFSKNAFHDSKDMFL